MATKGKLSERLTMPGQIHKAYKVLLKLLNPTLIKNDQGIPLSIIRKAKGIAFITVIKAGFVFSGTLGSGIVIVKNPDGTWSGPSSLGVAGMGWGALIGASSTDSVIILNTQAAVNTFSGKGQIKFGGNLSVAVGPVGRDAEVTGNIGDKGIAPCYSYSHSRGLFGGLSLQGAILAARDGDNKKFYGRSCTPQEILHGQIKPPPNEDLRLLYETLRKIERGETIRESSASMGSIEPIHYGGNQEKGRSMSASHTNLGPVAATSLSSTYDSNVSQEPLPNDWKGLTTPEGEKYYWNEKTNVTQWERPVGGAPKPPAPLVPQRPSAPPQNYDSFPSHEQNMSQQGFTSLNSPGQNRQPAIPVRSTVEAKPAIPKRPSAPIQTASYHSNTTTPNIPPRNYR